MLISDFARLAACSRCTAEHQKRCATGAIWRRPVSGSKLLGTACSPISRKPWKRSNNVVYPKHCIFEHWTWFTTHKTCACLKFQQPLLCGVSLGHLFLVTNQNQLLLSFSSFKIRWRSNPWAFLFHILTHSRGGKNWDDPGGSTIFAFAGMNFFSTLMLFDLDLGLGMLSQ